MIKKFRFYKMMLREILETLCTICLYLENEGHFSRNRHGQTMRLHFDSLKWYSDSIAGELEKNERRNKFSEDHMLDTSINRIRRTTKKCDEIYRELEKYRELGTVEEIKDKLEQLKIDE